MLLQLAGDLVELDRRTILLPRLADEPARLILPGNSHSCRMRAVHEGGITGRREPPNFLDRRAAIGSVSLHSYFLMLFSVAFLLLCLSY